MNSISADDCSYSALWCRNRSHFSPNVTVYMWAKFAPVQGYPERLPLHTFRRAAGLRFFSPVKSSIVSRDDSFSKHCKTLLKLTKGIEIMAKRQWHDSCSFFSSYCCTFAYSHRRDCLHNLIASNLEGKLHRRRCWRRRNEEGSCNVCYL